MVGWGGVGGWTFSSLITHLSVDLLGKTTRGRLIAY